MTRYETPTFAPGVAFSWTLRSAEIARRRSQGAPRYETPAFAPGVAFSWTLRSAEIARRRGSQPLASRPDSTQLRVLLAA